MDDTETMNVIREISRRAAAHRCTPYCVTVARGTPPARYWEKALRLAAGIGYSLSRSWEPAERSGPGCAGSTIGYVPGQCPGCGGNHGGGHTIGITPGQPPAEEFSTIAHEIAHAFLRHPAQDERDHFLKTLQKMYGTYDRAGEEIQAELAAAATGYACGLDVSSSICYLSGHVRSRQVQEDDQYAAFQAARVIAEALR
jgi:hypothetical protein